MPKNDTFYTYMLLREDGTPYYIGKGNLKRLKYSYSYSRLVPTPKDSQRILIQEFSSEEDAFAAEIFFISYYGRIDLGTGCLRNRTDGGDGISGLVRSEEHCRRISQAKMGFRFSDESRKKMSDSHRGQRIPLSLECRKHISEALKGKKHTEESRKKMSLSHTGKPWSEARRAA